MSQVVGLIILQDSSPKIHLYAYSQITLGLDLKYLSLYRHNSIPANVIIPLGSHLGSGVPNKRYVFALQVKFTFQEDIACES